MDCVARQESDGCMSCGGVPAPLPTADGWNWTRCPGCGLVALAGTQPPDAPPPVGEFSAADYIARYELRGRTKMLRSLRRAALLRLLNPTARRFADIGSNCGFMVEAASRLGFRATGVEPVPELVAWARARFPNRSFLQGMLEDVALPRAGFDVVYCSEVIEHAANPATFAALLAGLLRPGGMLMLTTPHSREYARRGWRAMQAPEHRQYFDFPSMTALLARHGFRKAWYKPTFGKGIIACVRRA